MKPPKLTVKEAAFVAEYLKTGNAGHAAIKAGYSEKSARTIGPRMLRKDAIHTHIASNKQKLAKRNHIDLDYLVDKFEALYSSAAKQQPELDMKGQPTKNYKITDGSTAAKAGQMIGQLSGHLNDRFFTNAKSDPVEIDYFDLESSMKNIIQDVRTQKITRPEGQNYMGMLKTAAQIKKEIDLEKRIQEIEEKLGIKV